MSHDSTKVLLGSHGSSDLTATCEPGDPATFLAGLAVRRDTSGNLSLGTGSLIGVSLGISMSDHAKTSVARVGNFIPVQLTDEGAFSELEEGDLTFTAVEKGEAGDSITIALVDGGTAGDEEVEVTGTDIVVNIDDGVSTAQQIADALEASEEAMALIGVAVASGQGAVAQDAFAETALADGAESYPYVVIGQPLEVSATTGKAVSNDELTGALYVSGVIKGVDPITKAEIDVALIDMGGGL